MKKKDFIILLATILMGCTTFGGVSDEKLSRPKISKFELQELNQAQKAFLQAKEANAQKYAPKSFKEARASLKKAKSLFALGKKAHQKSNHRPIIQKRCLKRLGKSRDW